MKDINVRIMVYLTMELFLAPIGLLALYMAWRIGKIGFSILREGYIPKGYGFRGQPAQDTYVNKPAGCFVLIFCLIGIGMGLFWIIGWALIIK